MTYRSVARGGVATGLLLFFSVQLSSSWSGAVSFDLREYFFHRYDTLDPIRAEEEFYKAPYKPSTRPQLRWRDRHGDLYSSSKRRSPFYLKDPVTETVIDVDTARNYMVYEYLGERYYRAPTVMSSNRFGRYENKRLTKKYWQTKLSEENKEDELVGGRALLPRIYVAPWFSNIFGNDFIEFHPNILMSIDWSFRWERVQNPAAPINQQRTWTPNLDPQLNANITGQVGDKLTINFNYDTQTPFSSFSGGERNNFKIEFTGYDEDIVKKIEIGDVAMPSGNSLMTGSQSLFGVKTKLQFGKLYITNVFTNQRGSPDGITIDNGKQGTFFTLRSSEYDENRHFFLGHFFRDNYEKWLENLPQITSGVNITRAEIYILNRAQGATDLRSLVAFTDLGEGRTLQSANNSNILPAQGDVPNGNEANRLFEVLTSTSEIRSEGQIESLMARLGLARSTDYEKITSARRLRTNEYVLHRSLGYITLTRRLQNDETLAVSYEYTYNGARYKVGELSEDYQSLESAQPIILKMLRPSTIDTSLTSWDLMMKNIYALNAFQVEQEGFELRIYYRDDAVGLNNPSLNEGANVKDRPLIELLGLDRLSASNDPPRDGNFDFVPGITVEQQKGLIIFPVLEPFGSTLQKHFDPQNEAELIEKYVYTELYEETQADALNYYEKDLFTLEGEYKASSGGSEYQLPAFGVVPNSVRVTAGGLTLREGTDYTVDYTLGKVNILNQGVLSSGKQISIDYEKSDLVSLQTRSMLATRLDYTLSPSVTLGSSLFYLTDRRGSVTRYQIGSEPIRNVKYGFDVNYKEESLLLTKGLDALPLLSTKEPSQITAVAEFAQLLPGTSNQVGGESTFYVESFESSATPVELGLPLQWQISSPPLELASEPGLRKSYRRAKVAWYAVDNEFYRLGNTAAGRENFGPAGIDNHYVRMILPQEIFPNRDVEQGITNEPIFNVAYFPSERGPYNYNPDLNNAGQLPSPRESWAGITRAITSEVDFEKANIEYFEFWLMDPFIGGEKGRVYDGLFNENNTTGGDLIFHLGEISEDINADGQLAFENGLPSDGDENFVLKNEWGHVATSPLVNRAFDNASGLARENQDVGFDGLKNELERSFFNDNYLEKLSVSPSVLSEIQADPSADDFMYYMDTDFDGLQASVVQRYKHFNRPDGNTPILGNAGQVRAGSNFPENEDLNKDNTLSQTNNYYEYKLSLRPGEMDVGKSRIVDKVESGDVSWYLFRVPLRSPDEVRGRVRNLKSMKFIRLYLTNFSQPVVLRFSKLHFIRSDWRRYSESLYQGNLEQTPPEAETFFDISSVSVEENNISLPGKSPYVVPPGVQRDRDDFSLNNVRENERSLQLCVRNLQDQDARAVFKTLQQNLVNYKRLKMFFHAHSEGGDLDDGDVAGLIRLGTDLKRNYYEIEVPLKVTPRFVRGANIERQVWPEENEIDLSFEELYQVKLARDREKAPLNRPFTQELRQYRITVFGRPRVSSLRVLLVGVRNPDSPDGMPKDACIWANELRVVDIERKNGWATNLSVGLKMADFADLNTSLSHKSVGFGSVQDRVQARARESVTDYDISSNVSLDKLIPGETGVKVPMFVSYQETVEQPEYDPLDQDVPLEEALAIREGEDRDRYAALTQDRVTHRSLNFTNVRKERLNLERTPMIYDIENFAFNYTYNDSKTVNITLAERLNKRRGGGFTYAYPIEDAYIEPFAGSGAFESPYLGPIKAINFNPLPSNLTCGAQLQRDLTRTWFRNAALTTEGVEPIYQKLFSFNRNYGLQWSIFKSTSLRYNAQVLAIIDEPQGEIDTSAKRQEIQRKILELGRMKNYQQNVDATHEVPFNNFPLTDWLKTSANYGAGYTWRGGALSQVDSLGNVIENQRNIGVNSRVDMGNIYKRLPLFKLAEGGRKPRRRNPLNEPSGGEGGQEESGQSWSQGLLKPLVMLRNVTFNYSLTHSTSLPGFRPIPYLIGMDRPFAAPGYAFILGDQDAGIRHTAAERGWLVRSSLQTVPFSQNASQNITTRATLEPLPALTVQLTARRTAARGYQEIYRYEPSVGRYQSLTPSQTGSYTASFLSIGTAFKERNYAFEKLQTDRTVLKRRWDQHNPRVTYGLNSQEVLASSFITAYADTDPNDFKLNPFLRFPLPNWQVSYVGLTALFKSFTELISSVTLTHSYNSNYAIGNFSSSLLYQQDLEIRNDPFGEGLLAYPLAYQVQDQRHIPFYIIDRISISESFSPLIGVNIGLENDMNIRTEYRTRRDAGLNFSNNQVTENYTRDIVINYTYTREKFKLPFDVRGQSYVLENALTFQANVTFRNSSTYQKILDRQSIETNGNDSWQYRVSVDYDLNQFLNWQIYAERRVNAPRISISSRLSNFTVGTRLRINWSE